MSSPTFSDPQKRGIQGGGTRQGRWPMFRLAVSVIGLIGVGTVCGVMNGVPDDSRQPARSPELCRLDTLRGEIDTDRLSVMGLAAQLEAAFRSQEDRKATILNLRQKLNSIARAHPAGIPPAIYQTYSLSRAKHDALVDTYDSESRRYAALYADYSARVERFNRRLNEADELARKIGKPWSIAGIPEVSHRPASPDRG